MRGLYCRSYKNPDLTAPKLVFLHFPSFPARSFLPLISTPTGFHDWGLATKWAQLLITSNYYQPSTPIDQSTMRAELQSLLDSGHFLFPGGSFSSLPGPECEGHHPEVELLHQEVVGSTRLLRQDRRGFQVSIPANKGHYSEVTSTGF